eukprot:COSAG01_NODE_8434_length_2785_cov_26.842517_2_plen_59_part_00
MSAVLNIVFAVVAGVVVATAVVVIAPAPVAAVAVSSMPSLKGQTLPNCQPVQYSTDYS